MDVELTESEHDLMGRVCQFAAARLGPNQSVYMGTMYSRSLGCPVYLVVAMGDQALQLETILTKAQVQSPDSLIQRMSEKGF